MPSGPAHRTHRTHFGRWDCTPGCLARTHLPVWVSAFCWRLIRVLRKTVFVWICTQHNVSERTYKRCQAGKQANRQADERNDAAHMNYICTHHMDNIRALCEWVAWLSFSVCLSEFHTILTDQNACARAHFELCAHKHTAYAHYMCNVYVWMFMATAHHTHTRTAAGMCIAGRRKAYREQTGTSHMPSRIRICQCMHNMCVPLKECKESKRPCACVAHRHTSYIQAFIYNIYTPYRYVNHTDTKFARKRHTHRRAKLTWRIFIE